VETDVGEWYEEFHAAVDAMDADALGARCTPDTRVQMANHPPAVGSESVLEAPSGFRSTIRGMRHELRLVLEEGDAACIEAVVHHTRKDGSEVAIPAVTMSRRDGELVAEQRIHIDLAPLTEGTAG
jgi:ketosteroid isomerase-like protein